MIAQKEYLKAQTKKNVVANLKNGDVLKIKSEVFPFVYHYVVIEKDNEGLFIYHNQPDKLNKLGGSLIREPLKDYIKGKEIVGVENLGDKKVNLPKMFDVLMTQKYNVVKNNCEHYINFLKTKKYSSPQVASWTLALLLITTFYIIHKKK